MNTTLHAYALQENFIERKREKQKAGKKFSAFCVFCK